LDEEIVADLNFVYRNLGIEGLDFGFGVNNVLDEDIVYPQPYEKPGDFRAGPYPGPSREFYASLAYHMPF
jgi:hypothetical protein